MATSWTMWLPLDISAFPSNGEIQTADEVFFELEGRLKAALETLRDAQTLVDDLKREIERRRAWLSPIRRLTFDVISYIFVEASKGDWKAPLTLEQVCKGWHGALLSTPRAWSYIHITNDSTPAIVFKYLTRSLQSPLHMTIANDAHPLSSLSLISHHPARLSSLQIYATRIPHRLCLLPKLQSLHIEGRIHGSAHGRDRLEGLRWDSNTLKYLNIDMAGDWSPFESRITQSFKYLQHLVFRNTESDSWIRILEACAATLKVLELRSMGRGRRYFSQSEAPSFAFPSLEHLEVEDYGGWNRYGHSDGGRIFEATTPNLQSYSEFDFYLPALGLSRTIFHIDTSQVVQLHTNVLPYFPQYPNLRRLHLSSICVPFKHIIQGFSKYQVNEQCPHLHELILHDQEGDMGKCTDAQALLHALGVSITVRSGHECTFETPSYP